MWLAIINIKTTKKTIARLGEKCQIIGKSPIGKQLREKIVHPNNTTWVVNHD